jgi:hypothetical protein
VNKRSRNRHTDKALMTSRNKFGRGIAKDLKLSEALLADRAKERHLARTEFEAARRARGKT